ncbi:MAG: hypothetical protein ACKO1M_13340 [Planctomycetota bacterium]
MIRAVERAPARGLVGAVCIAIALAATVRSDDAVVVGIGGVHRTGSWTPLAIPVADGSSESLRAWVPDADGQPVGSPPLAAAGAGVARACIRPGRPTAGLTIEQRDSGQGGGAATGAAAALADAAAPLPGIAVASTTPLVLVHGDLPAAAAALRLVAGERTSATAVRLAAAPIPPRLTPRDLDAFDEAILCGRDLAPLPRDTLVALDGWIRGGGQLVFIAGESAVAVAARGPPASDWLPGSVPRLVPLRRFGSLEAFARAGGLAGRVPPQGVEVPRFDQLVAAGGVVEAFEGSRREQPLVIRRAHGLGTITWLGVDIDAAWVAAWPGCDRLLAALLGGRAAAHESVALADVGRPRVPDLAGQLRVALDTFPAPNAARGVPFEILAGLGVLYALALYPLDWWLVSRSGRPWVSWLTLTALAGGFTAATWAVGGLWGHHAPPRCQDADLLDIDVAGGLVRGSSWLAVSSPGNAALDITVAASTALPVTGADAAVSWFADGGTGFGGVDAATAHPSLAAHDYTYGDSLAELVGVPIAAASSRLFEAAWTAATTAPTASSTLVRDARGLVQGTLVHRLPFALEDCRLLHAGWLYDIGDFEPGETFDTESGRGPRSLAAALTRRVAVGDRDRAERWDTAGLDVARILEVAGLHAAAGGVGYTGLDAGRLRRLDLSPLLAVDRAIIVGRAPAGVRGSAWEVRQHGSGEAAIARAPEAADSRTLVRIVIPLPEAHDAATTPPPTEETP